MTIEVDALHTIVAFFARRANSKNPPPVLPDESSAPGKNIVLSEIEKL
jgi:hypothetical protein